MRKMSYERKMRNLLFVLVFFSGLFLLVGYCQISINDAKNTTKSSVTMNWKEKTSMKYDTIEYDWSDEEPMIEEQLKIAKEIRRIG